MRKQLFTTILLFGAISAIGQKPKIIEVDHTSWSGGIAGHSGENYAFVVEFPKTVTEPEPDTLWLGQSPTRIIVTSKNENLNTRIIHKNGTTRFEISAGTFRDEYADRNPMYAKKNTAAPKPPIGYKGVALLTYQYNGKRHYLVFPTVTKDNPPVNYP